MRSRPTPSAPSSTALAASRGRAQVREHLDPGAVAGGAGLVRALAGRRPPLVGALAPLGRVALHIGGWVDQHRARLAVEQHGRAVLDLEDRVAETDDRRQPERTREDRRVGGGGAVRGGDPGHERGIERGGIAGRELAGDHDARSARAPGPRRPR